MTKMHRSIAGALMLCSSLIADTRSASAAGSMSRSKAEKVEREFRAFYESCAEDLRRLRLGSLISRYDPRGVFFSGDGRKAFETFDALENHYLTEWRGPRSFRRRDLSVEVLSPDAVVVVGRFEWQSDEGDVLTFSYTSLLVRHAGSWRIRVEDESR